LINQILAEKKVYPYKREIKVSIPGPQGLLEGKMHLSDNVYSPVALIFHTHPKHGGTMNNKVVYGLTQTFREKNFHTLRINFRGVEGSQGSSEGGDGEVDDALAALDWFAKKCELRCRETLPIWVAGFSFGGWVALQVAMRRPEISGFISVSPPMDTYNFNMLTPCPNGLIVQGTKDHIVSAERVEEFSNQLICQKGCKVYYDSIDCDHYFTNKLDYLKQSAANFLDEHVLKNDFGY
jgi:alpha/beta superfamily hydrolase